MNLILLTNVVTRPSLTQNPIAYSFCNAKKIRQKLILHVNHKIREHINPVEKSTKQKVPIPNIVLLMSSISSYFQ